MEIPKSFLGYKRENGRAGTRNHVIILPVDDISNACAESVANNIKGTIALPHSYGRLQFGADLELHFRTMIGTGSNPNVAAVIVIGIEPKWTKRIVDGIAKTGKPVEGFHIERTGDIGNNCAIGNAYPTFEKPRKYLAPGLFGPCGYGFPSILGAKIGCPDTPVIGFAGDGAFGISMNEMSSCARKEWPAITMVIFRNYQWGAEKRNTTLWFDNNFVGTELDPELSFAKVADACGLKGVTVKTMEETTAAIKKSCEDQKKGITTFIEVILNQELGEPFRRDAMKKPVRVAGIKKEDMKKQPSLT